MPEEGMEFAASETLLSYNEMDVKPDHEMAAKLKYGVLSHTPTSRRMSKFGG